MTLEELLPCDSPRWVRGAAGRGEGRGRDGMGRDGTGRVGSGRAAVPLSPAEPRTERAVPRRMRAVGAAVERLLAAAQRSARLSVGVYEAAKLLNA